MPNGGDITCTQGGRVVFTDRADSVRPKPVEAPVLVYWLGGRAYVYAIPPGAVCEVAP